MSNKPTKVEKQSAWHLLDWYASLKNSFILLILGKIF